MWAIYDKTDNMVFDRRNDFVDLSPIILFLNMRIIYVWK